MNPEHRSRFEQLIQFLKELPPEKFDFGHVVTQVSAPYCGTICCAIGWTPKLFPELVRWPRRAGLPLFVVKDDGSEYYSAYYEVAHQLFGLPLDISEALFQPDGQHRVSPLLKKCEASDSPSEVAAMLEVFLELWLAGRIPIRLKDSSVQGDPLREWFNDLSYDYR